MKKNNYTQNSLANDLINFISESKTQFHATLNLENMLKVDGFKRLDETKQWNIKKGGKFYVTRSDSSLIAFKINNPLDAIKGFKMLGAHTDSPCLKVKSNPNKITKSYYQTAVEIYGGPILPTWFDRDLSLAGKINYLNKSGELKSCLVDFKDPIATIPSVAIHLDRTQNDKRTINKQKDVTPLLALVEGKTKINLIDFLKSILRKDILKNLKEILDFDLSFYDTQNPAILGINKDLIVGGKLDNLLSCFISITALINSKNNKNLMVVCNDHEECGSNSNIGANGPFLKAILDRIAGTLENYHVAISNSIMISLDNAHAVHPNFVEKNDEGHAPELNKGPVIKINNNQRYATNSETSAYFMSICKKAKVPYQKFISRNDFPCGSTIGPLTATATGVKTLDVGAPTFGMHSIRETTGVKDPFYIYKAVLEHFK